MIDADVLIGTVFSGLTTLTINEIDDAGEVIVVHARTRGGAVQCPSCGNVDPAGPRVPSTGARRCARRRTACAGPCSGATDALSRARLFPADVSRTGPGRAGTLSTPDGAAE